MTSTKEKKICILTLFGTRPEVIKLAPVIHALEKRPDVFETLNVTSGQHKDILYPFIRQFRVRVDYDLALLQTNQLPIEICSRAISALTDLFSRKRPDMVLVQGDTTTALAGALTAFYLQIPVGHVEAGLRSGDENNPFPEEMNRRLITRLARYHFAATEDNAKTLGDEGIPMESIIISGNPVVDALRWSLNESRPSEATKKLLDSTSDKKLIVLTSHRRESFGDLMLERLSRIAAFIRRHEDVAMIFPVHPNPAVRETATRAFAGVPRAVLIDPLDYFDFIHLLFHSWLIVSDSGGVQEEAPTLKKPLLILRENTERPEAVESGVARLVGPSPQRLESMLEDIYQTGTWAEELQFINNPFGSGDAGQKIADAIESFLGTA
ncbi:non-hydrolyzing UDP-N-acetylglucosamine 2-epimerase [Thermodesulfobacteriota bacterium B35]